MLIDERGKLFGKINIIDLLIIVILIAGVAFVGMKFVKARLVTSLTATDEIRIVFFSEEVPDYAAKAIKTGDLFKDPYKNTVLGKVTEVKIDKAVSYGVSGKGEWVASSKPGYVSLYLTIVGKGVFVDGKVQSGVMIDNADYWIGRLMEVRAGNTAMQGRIYNMTNGR